jgi:zinc transporter, ZIP family
VTTAVLFGLAASSALVIGALIGAWADPPKGVIGVLLAFASGALFSALAFELFDEAIRLGGVARSSLGLLVGAAVFVAADTALDRYASAEAGARSGKAPNAARSAVGWALLAAVTLDGVPENPALGASLVESASVALLVAIFASNLPEALAGSVAMRKGRRDKRAVLSTWTASPALLAAGVVAGTALAEQLSDEFLSLALSFAGGAVIASLADTLMPEAYELGDSPIAFATAIGFLVSFVLA